MWQRWEVSLGTSGARIRLGGPARPWVLACEGAILFPRHLWPWVPGARPAETLVSEPRLFCGT